MKEFIFSCNMDGLRVQFDRHEISKCDLIGDISIKENGTQKQATVNVRCKSIHQYMNALLGVIVGDIVIFCGLVNKIERIDAENNIFKITGEFNS